MEIYKDEAAIAALVARMIVQALQLHQPALVMTTPSIKARIAEALEEAGLDVQLLDTERKVHMLDEQVLRDTVMDGDLPNAERFNEIVSALLEGLCVARRNLCVIMIYSDMADALVRANNLIGARALEQMWNRLAARFSFSLVCGYAAAGLNQHVPTFEELRELCEQHNVIRLLRH